MAAYRRISTSKTQAFKTVAASVTMTPAATQYSPGAGIGEQITAADQDRQTGTERNDQSHQPPGHRLGLYERELAGLDRDRQGRH